MGASSSPAIPLVIAPVHKGVHPPLARRAFADQRHCARVVNRRRRVRHAHHRGEPAPCRRRRASGDGDSFADFGPETGADARYCKSIKARQATRPAASIHWMLVLPLPKPPARPPPPCRPRAAHHHAVKRWPDQITHPPASSNEVHISHQPHLSNSRPAYQALARGHLTDGSIPAGLGTCSDAIKNTVEARLLKSLRASCTPYEPLPDHPIMTVSWKIGFLAVPEPWEPRLRCDAFNRAKQSGSSAIASEVNGYPESTLSRYTRGMRAAQRS